MAIGDDTIAAGMDVCSGTVAANTIDTEITKTRDYIAQRTSDVQTVAKGGTGATNATAARTNLGAAPTVHTHTVAQITDYATVTQNALTVYTYDKPALDATFNLKATLGADVTFGQVFVPSSYAAVSGYTIAYINSDGRISKGASSERYKKFISEVDPESVGDIFPQLHQFQMRSLDGTGDGAWKLGYIAERLDENDDQQRFVVYDAEGQPDSIDFIQLFMVQIAQLNARIAALEAER